MAYVKPVNHELLICLKIILPDVVTPQIEYKRVNHMHTDTFDTSPF